MKSKKLFPPSFLLLQAYPSPSPSPHMASDLRNYEQKTRVVMELKYLGPPTSNCLRSLPRLLSFNPSVFRLSIPPSRIALALEVAKAGEREEVHFLLSFFALLGSYDFPSIRVLISPCSSFTLVLVILFGGFFFTGFFYFL